MKLNTRKEKGWLVITLEGRVDTLTAPELDQQLDAYVQAGHTDFLFDLMPLEYISSAGFRSLVALSKKVSGKNGRIAVSGLHGVVEDAFRLSGFAAIMTIFPSVKEAPPLN